MFRFYQTLAVLICLAKCIQVYGDLRGDKVVRLEPTTSAHLDYLRSLEDDGSVDFWTEILAAGRPVDVHITKKDFNKFAAKFRQQSLPYTVVVDDLQKIIDIEQQDMAQQIAGRQMNRPPGQQRIDIAGLYVSYGDMVTYMEEKAQQKSQINVVNVATTFQNRIIKGVEMKYNPSAQRNIWIDCGIHAREWISPATCIWIIDKFISEYDSGNAEVRALLDYWNVYIVPSLNPDGYEYSRSTSANRLWRKSRNTNSGSTCIGVDLNRNYPNNWMTGGASTNPCSDTFGGRSAASESETAGVVSFLNGKKGTWDMYMSFHSYGQWWFTPYGYSARSPPDYADQKKMADIGASAIQSVSGTKYDVGTVAQLLYIASGSTVDWAYETLGIKYSYTIELPPPSSDSATGFVLPPSRAPGVCDETYRGMKTFLTAIKNDLQSSSG